jgi:hypothetical protein
VYFGSDGSWNQTNISKMRIDQLPLIIQTYFKEKFPNAEISEINFSKNVETANYEIVLLDDKTLYFDEKGVLTRYVFKNLAEKDLPLPITNYLKLNYSKNVVTDIWRQYYFGSANGASTEYFVIFFDNYQSITLLPDGTLFGKK